MRIAGDLLSPLLLLSKTNHRIALVLQAFRVLLVSFAPLSVVVEVPVDVDCGLVVLVIEIGTGATGLDQVLRVRWQSLPMLFQEAQPGTLQFGTGQAQQLRNVHRARLFRWSRLNPRFCQVKQYLADGLPVEQTVVPLVRVGHQAVVAGRFAVLPRSWGTAYVGPALWIKVAEAQGLPCDLRKRQWFLEQS